MTTSNYDAQEKQPSGSIQAKLEGVRVGNTTAIAFNDTNALKNYQERLLSHAYGSSETKHFIVCQQSTSVRIVILHTFRQEMIDADLICFIEHELTSFGFMHSAREFGATLFAVIASTFSSPRHQPSIWRRFCVNTLERLREQLANTQSLQIEAHPYTAPFAGIYQRVRELSVGERFLDVGCSFGFLPIIMKEWMPNGSIVGFDNNPDMIRCAIDMASFVEVEHILFRLHDILAPDVADIGQFDTVTALHVLEHLQEKDVCTAFEHLLKITSKRLIIAVPYEDKMEELYGHQQIFTPEKLQNWGEWCMQHLEGMGRYWCEDVMGGILVVDRFSG